MPKRRRNGQLVDESVQVHDTSTTTITSKANDGDLSSSQSRKAKRTRTGDVERVILQNTTNTASKSPIKPLSASLPSRPIIPPKPKIRPPLTFGKKRPLLPGKLRRLAVPKPVSLASRKGASGSTKDDVNRRGHKINKSQGTGGFAASTVSVDETGEDVGVVTTSTKGKGKAIPEQKPAVGDKSKVPSGAELWVTRKTAYSVYLKTGVAAFIERGNHTLTLRALGAAIPTCLSLGLAIRDALPCGSTGCTLEVRTGSIDVNDEILPDDDDSDNEDADIQYQVRTKSTVECVLKLRKAVRQRLLLQAAGVVLDKRALGAREMGVRPGRGGRGKSRGGGVGRGRGRGRGR